MNINNAQETENIIKTQWLNRAAAYASVVADLQLAETTFLAFLETELMRLSSRVVVN